MNKLLLAAVLLGGAASPALAATVVTTGTTVGRPTFNRPVSTSALSLVGTAVPYDLVLFTVDQAGSYVINLTATTALYDPFLALYNGPFSAASPLNNLIEVNDDLAANNFTQSQITRILVAGQIYRAVVTGFDNLDFGTYTLTFSGPGNINVPGAGAVPEPATWLMMIGGFGLVGAGLRRRRGVGVAAA